MRNPDQIHVGETVNALSELMGVAPCDRDGLVAFYRAYIDESNIHAGAPVTSVAIILSRPTLWKNWTRGWNATKAPIKIFHAVDCANFRGEFEGWSVEKRDTYVAKLLAVIGRFQFVGEVFAIDNRDVERARKQFSGMDGAINSPYLTCLQLAMHRITEYLARHHQGDKIAFIHEENDFKREALICFDWIKSLPENRGLDLVSFKFAAKKDAVPLQAADVFAYEGAKRIKNRNGPERRAWRALNPGRNKVTLDHLEYDGIMNWMKRLEREGVQIRGG
jgi:Protein of unknown function (DUF3800)